MQVEIDKKIEALTNKIMQEVPKASPSLDFTNAVMSQVKALDNKAITKYKPLISKRSWFALSLVLFLTTAYLLINANTENSNWITKLDFSTFTVNLTESVPNVTLPKTFNYAILLFAIMVCVQVPILKNYFDRRLHM